MHIFEHISKSAKSPAETKEDQRMHKAEQALAEEQKPLFEVRTRRHFHLIALLRLFRKPTMPTN